MTLRKNWHKVKVSVSIHQNEDNELKETIKSQNQEQTSNTKWTNIQQRSKEHRQNVGKKEDFSSINTDN